jgi:hypothetical protein
MDHSLTGHYPSLHGVAKPVHGPEGFWMDPNSVRLTVLSRYPACPNPPFAFSNDASCALSLMASLEYTFDK